MKQPLHYIRDAALLGLALLVVSSVRIEPIDGATVNFRAIPAAQAAPAGFVLPTTVTPEPLTQPEIDPPAIAIPHKAADTTSPCLLAAHQADALRAVGVLKVSQVAQVDDAESSQCRVAIHRSVAVADRSDAACAGDDA